MPIQSNTSANSRRSASRKQLLQNLRFIVDDQEAHLYVSADHIGEDAKSTKKRIQKNLNTVKKHLLLELPQANITNISSDQFISENPWKTLSISACANMIVSMQNARR